MIGPKGTRNAAPSIWSFDSGYGSSLEPSEGYIVDPLAPATSQDSSNGAEFEGPSTLDYAIPEAFGGDVKFGSFWNVHVGDQVQLQQNQPSISPVVTRLSVFTSKDCTRTNSIFLCNGQAPDFNQSCVACELWEITNPGEDIRCDKCSVSNPVLELLCPAKEPKAMEGVLKSDQRCSACELSALINPGNASKCPSCSPAIPALEPICQQEDAKVTRSRARRTFKLPLSALTKLQAWLDANQHDPYPSAEVKKQLAQECGITEKQVTTWFTNARARQLNPMEIWLSSNSEDEAASESDIVEAAQDTKYSTFTQPPQLTKFGISHSRAESVSASSAYTSFSQHSTTRRSAPSRRGKKKIYRKNRHPTSQPAHTALPTPTLTPARTPGPRTHHPSPTSPSQETWQCTFCLKHLAPKSWRRHEETQHLPRSSYSCMLHGARLFSAAPSTSPLHPRTSQVQTSFCAFCMLRDPPDAHFHTAHRIVECAARSLADRTFYRPDHLRQHVKNYHNCTLFDLTSARWKQAAQPVAGPWGCGFCGAELESWDARETHIANHFRDGMAMAQWTLPKAGSEVEGIAGGKVRTPTAPRKNPRTPQFAAAAFPTQQEHYPFITTPSFTPGDSVIPYHRALSLPPPPPLPPLLLPHSPSLSLPIPDDVLMETCGNFLDSDQLPVSPFGSLQSPFGSEPWMELSDAEADAIKSAAFEYGDGFVGEGEGEGSWGGF
ncbi:hypothetical protein K432DRAFT_345563 [Lepidopterella palustris CBS 459.81]|uniref:Homeobox domain-containing protein n=1 Tax=Lepidopterella palustris CBS 459.81 TaxID=1314670 RepID=A0A8E2JJ36_9PEZI|nr:hypothetical protein K432DRAFT_345563 [Lepidopterella palustris CBS 459.81]